MGASGGALRVVYPVQMACSERAGQPTRHGGPRRASGPEGEVLLEPGETCGERDLVRALARGRGRNKSLPNRPCREAAC